MLNIQKVIESPTTFVGRRLIDDFDLRSQFCP